MLTGNYHHSLQAKGRLAIPSAFRSQLGEKPILTRGFDPHLNLLPFNIWSKLTQNLGGSPLETTTQRHLRRLIAHNATQIEFDSQGRILIPQILVDAVNLKQKVVIAGSIDWIEIWDIDTFFSYQSQLSTKAPQLIDQLNQPQQN